MLRLIYRTLFAILAPFLKIYFYGRCFYGKDRWKDVENHFGVATLERPKGKLYWIHSASIGESTSALTYVRHLKKQHPELNILMTTITVTSTDMLLPKIEKIDGCFHQFAVADNPAWIRKFLDHWKPDAAFFLESEIWPNMIDSLHRNKIPIFLLNARLSPRSFKRWRHFHEFFAATLRRFNGILAQSDVDAARFSFFSPHNVELIDNLKYANEPLPCNGELYEIFQNICAGKRIFVAVSTHEKEEEVILEAHRKLKAQFPIVTIIVPRHLTRIKRICEIFQKHDVAFSLRSAPQKNSEVFCVDSFGEIGTFLRLADVCFVGGSLVPVGGHNIYEPIVFGKPVLHGPFMDNAPEMRDFLAEKKIAFQVKNAEDISEICGELFTNGARVKQIAELATQIAKNDALRQIDSFTSSNGLPLF
ncbi:MAG: 3-deoxy-D-manno-octulosonic acid transferase [Holosporaceae bacterium]|jgi:3-deoxy-D-manno-octulosonic-acid transferase|nr:3-deoxy-D-manno-octulosonic acid transferase [Holosporaceae bacterium]